MQKFKLWMFVLIAGQLVALTNMYGQPGSEVKDVDVLTEQKKVFAEQFPHLFAFREITDVEKISKNHSKIYYSRGNRDYEAVVNSNRKDMLLVAVCEEIPMEEIPEIVKDVFHKSEYGKFAIQKTFEVTTPYSTNFYRVDFNPSGEKEGAVKSVFYDRFGDYVPPPY